MTNIDKTVSEKQEKTGKPLAWKYMLGDGKWRYQKEWSNGAEMHPVYELTPEVLSSLQ